MPSNNNDQNFDDESDDEHDFYQLVLAGCAAAATFTSFQEKKPCRTSSHTGYKFVMDVLNGHEIRCFEQFRMEKHVFMNLLETLTKRYGLKEGFDMPLIEVLAMFLTTIGHGLSNRMIQERFQHSGESVSRWFEIVLDVVCLMAVDIIKPSDPQFKEVPDKIRNDDRYWPYFKNCIGVIDGTHIPVVVPRDRKIPYIGRKGVTTQNVMAVCDFNMCFTFAWAGWEGVAHDARVFLEALRRPELGFPHPPKGL